MTLAVTTGGTVVPVIGIVMAGRTIRTATFFVALVHTAAALHAAIVQAGCDNSSDLSAQHDDNRGHYQQQATGAGAPELLMITTFHSGTVLCPLRSRKDVALDQLSQVQRLVRSRCDQRIAPHFAAASRQTALEKVTRALPSARFPITVLP